jgi:hypothetical protein
VGGVAQELTAAASPPINAAVLERRRWWWTTWTSWVTCHPLSACLVSPRLATGCSTVHCLRGHLCPQVADLGFPGECSQQLPPSQLLQPGMLAVGR